ncbi:hypothetical protein M9H77_17385 [Catharanthus roseus]|uniref:Uncharacterized protein n=1 Tax=Catharanthus roseus TaxID=4058 RepID=A0ACC0B4F8_CATRO|nr:hypothetical protein M9H77_17385 [Catharanthus roseus]
MFWISSCVQKRQKIALPDRCPRICSLVLCEWKVQWLWNRALVRCLAGIDYEIPELISDDLGIGSGLCPWSLTIVLHVLLNLGVEAILMCLDSLRLPSCIRPLILVLRGTQIPYSAAINLMEGLVVSQVVLEHLGTRWHTTLIDGYTRRARSWAVPAGLHHHRCIPLGRLSQRGTQFR